MDGAVRPTVRPPTADFRCLAYNVPTMTGPFGPNATTETVPANDDYTGPATETNTAFLSPDHAVWFHGAAGVVLVLGLLGIWAASTGKRGQSES
jgi:hypothetical protein